MSNKKPRIVVEYVEGEGVRTRVDHAFNRDHALWMLGQAIITITTPEPPEIGDVETGEVVEDEPMQELPTADEQEEEVNLSDLPN